MAQKKSNKKKKKSVADLVLEHHFDDKIKDVEIEESTEVSDEIKNDNLKSEISEEEVSIPIEDEDSDAENIVDDEKIDEVDEVVVEEIPSENAEQDEQGENAENIEVSEDNLKTDVKDFLEKSDEILNSVKETNQNNSAEAVKQLQDFLSRVDKKVDKLARVQAKKDDEINIVGDEYQFKKLKNELTFFQNELEENIHGQFGDLSETVASVINEMKHKIEELQEYLEQDTAKRLRQVMAGVTAVKSELDSVSNEVGAIDKQAIFDTEKRTKQIIGLTKKSKDELVAEIQDLKRISARAAIIDAYNEENKALFERTNQDNVELFSKTNAENVALFESRSAENLSTIKNELSQVRNNLHTQIQEILRKIVVQDEIKSLCDDALTEIRNNNSEIGVVRKFMKGTQSVEQRQEELLDEIRILVEDLSEYELNEASDKVDIIYENIGMLNEWANKSDKLIEDFDSLREDFDINSDKVDIIYDNLTFINDWVKTLDKFAKDIEDLKSDFERDEKLTDKIDSLYTNINAIKDWSKKADALALQVRALSVQISETESTINSQNLADIKELFTQMTEDMSNLSSRTNKMILDTDKTNDTMIGHLNNLKSIIDSLKDTSDGFEFAELKNKIDDIKINAQKSTDFEQVMTEAFGYLAEWIDSAGSMINQIRTDLNSVQSQQDEQLEQINKQYNEQVDRLSEIKSSFESLSQAEEQTENDVAEQIAQIIAQNNMAIQNIVTKQNDEIQNILTVQNQQIQKILEEQNIQAQNIQALQMQAVQTSANLQQIHEQNDLSIKEIQSQTENLIENVQNIQEQSNQIVQNIQEMHSQSDVVAQNLQAIQEQSIQVNQNIQAIQEQSIQVNQNIQAIQEQSVQVNQNVQQIQSDISEEIQQIQPQSTPIVENNTDEEILEKLNTIAEYIEQKDESQQIVESIEEKISSLKPDNSELKNLLDFIASQVVSANENSMKTEMLSRKIDSMETKLSSLEQYMARLIEYLDEDE